MLTLTFLQHTSDNDDTAEYLQRLEDVELVSGAEQQIAKDVIDLRMSL